MSRELRKLKKDLKGILAQMIQSSDLCNSDNFIGALLDIELKEDKITGKEEYIPDEELQKVLEEIGVHNMIDLLYLVAESEWSDYND